MERDETIVVRLPAAVKAAVKQAANDDHGRSMSAMVVRILTEWLTEHEYLSAVLASAGKRKGKA
jgi:hypothetical protein